MIRNGQARNVAGASVSTRGTVLGQMKTSALFETLALATFFVLPLLITSSIPARGLTCQKQASGKQLYAARKKLVGHAFYACTCQCRGSSNQL